MSDLTELHDDLRDGVRQLCARFPGEYWQQLDKAEAYPTEFVKAMTEAGYLGALIPEEYGGVGVGITEASIILEEVHRAGGNAAACHAQMYIMGTLLRHGSDEQKSYYLPKIASGELRLQAFGVTEPDAGTDTTSLRTR
ncbi:MAG: acyl-CoA dehydrogenase family protein, partial [Anaerolineae bacterium]